MPCFFFHCVHCAGFLCANSTFHNYSVVFRAGHYIEKKRVSLWLLIDFVLRWTPAKNVTDVQECGGLSFCHRSNELRKRARYTNDRKNDQFFFSTLEFDSAGLYSIDAIEEDKNCKNYSGLWSVNVVFEKNFDMKLIWNHFHFSFQNSQCRWLDACLPI